MSEKYSELIKELNLNGCDDFNYEFNEIPLLEYKFEDKIFNLQYILVDKFCLNTAYFQNYLYKILDTDIMFSHYSDIVGLLQ